MQVFLQKVLHKKEDDIIKNIMDMKIFGSQSIDTVKEKMFMLEKFGIEHSEIGWFKGKKRWVGPGDYLPWFIPQFWFMPAAYIHDITFLILQLIADGKSTHFEWMTYEISNNLFLAIARAYKPWWIPWNSVTTKFYKFMLDTAGRAFNEDE